ncbi:MAG TPA: hypothetical protein VJ866_01665 [Pyrinomonadaceae bacterium]|nr:hypothetical protein [Pyrinomonadaceae bacterium]
MPEDEPVTNLIFNVTSAGGVDFSLFDARRSGRHGYTLLGSVNYQKEYDVDSDDFTELPRARSFNLSPRFFFSLDDKTRLTVGNSTSVQKREGGDVFVIRDAADAVHQYFERNDSVRNITTLQLDRDLSGGRRVVARQSLAFFGREIEIPEYRFEGNQFNAYTDISYFHPLKSHALVFGFNAAYDRFIEGCDSGSPLPRDETRRTFGGYAQDSFNVTDKLSLEAYYTSSQYLTDRDRTRPFRVAGVFGEKSFGKYSLFFNAENVTDTRQSRFGTVVFPPHQNPTFAEIYTHTEGRVFNGGIKVRL